MKRIRAVIVGCLVALGAFALPSAAGAHTLTEERALKASLRGAEKHCEADAPSCDTFDAGNCRRPAAEGHRRRHKVQCDVLLAGTDDVGDWQCTWVDQWTLTKSNKLRWSQKVYNETYDGCPYVEAGARSKASGA